MRGLVFIVLMGCVPGDDVALGTPFGAADLGRSGPWDTADSGLELVPTADDSCPSDPAKMEPGFCGCGWIDVDADGANGPDACIHMHAVVDVNATVGVGASIAAGAVIGNAAIGAGATVAEGAEVGDGSNVGADSLLSRNATLGTNSDIGPETVLGRSSRIGHDVDASVGFLTLGYDSEIGDGSVITGRNVVIGNRVTIGDDVTLHEGVVLARMVVVESGAEIGAFTVVGPDTQIGAAASIGESVRIRKRTTLGGNTVVGDGTRIGRDGVIESDVTLPADARLGALVFVGANNTLMGDIDLPRRARIEPIAGGIDTPPEVFITGPNRGADVSGGTIVLTGTATDDRGVASLSVRFNDGAALILPIASGAFSETIVVPDNTQTIRVTATDTIGQTGNDIVVVDDCTLDVMPPFVWTGSVSDDWSNGNNWVGSVPPDDESDIFVCGAVVPQPALSSSREVRDLSMSGTATLDTNGRTLTANGDVVAGVINGGGVLLMSTDNTTLRGVVPRLDVRGEIDLSGYTLATGAVSVTSSHELDVNSRTFHAGATYNQDTNASSGGLYVGSGGVAIFEGEASFNGTRDMGAGNIGDGTLRFRGGLTVQDISTRVFRPSDTQPTIFEGAGNQTITMRNSRSTGNRLGDIVIAGPGSVFVDASTDLFVDGTTSIADGATLSVPSADFNGDIVLVGTGQLTGSVVDMYANLSMGDASTVNLNTLNTHTRLPVPQGTFTVAHVDVVDDVSLEGDWDNTIADLRVLSGAFLRTNGHDLTLTGNYSQEIGDGAEGLILSTDDTATFNGDAYFGGTRFMNASNLASGTLRFRGDLLVQDIAITLFLPSETRPAYFDGPGDQTLTMRGSSSTLSRLGPVIIGGSGTVSVDASTDLYIGGETTIEDGARFSAPSAEIHGDISILGTGELAGSVVDMHAGLSMDGTATVNLNTLRTHNRLPFPAGTFAVGTVDVVGDAFLQSDWDYAIPELRVRPGATLQTDGHDFTLSGNYSQEIGGGLQGLRMTAGDVATFNGDASFSGTQFMSGSNLTDGTLRFRGDLFVQDISINVFHPSNSTVVVDGAGNQTLNLGRGLSTLVTFGSVFVGGSGTKTFVTAGTQDIVMAALTVDSGLTLDRDTTVLGDLLVANTGTLVFGANAFSVNGTCTVNGTAPPTTCN